jgi:beta-lactamase superfamily II metal-dependent hydrolase
VAAGPDGWVKRSHTKKEQGLKIFFVDVGQGDGALVEADGRRYLIDGGPNMSLMRYLTGWQYRWALRANPPQQVHFDGVFVSHFDADHYAGLTPILADSRFTFGSIWHNGIARFVSAKAKRPAGHDSDLGQRSTDRKLLLTHFDDIQSAKDLLTAGGLQTTFRKFLQAVVKADTEGRIRPEAGQPKLARLEQSDDPLIAHADSPFRIRALGPVFDRENGQPACTWLGSSSHTRNGHSLILRLEYGNQSALMTGDLNEQSHHHLLARYTPAQRQLLAVDVAKSCHHGSSEYLTEFVRDIGAPATVISSGDNENYAHPRADAMGVVAKTSRADHPLIFSTELARSVRSGEDVLYGMINARTDGQTWTLAQMKEKRSGTDVWDSYQVPFVHV